MFRRISLVVAVISVLALAACGSSAPSAQCRRQFRLAAADLRKARFYDQMAMSGSAADTGPGSPWFYMHVYLRFSETITKEMKAEGCPDSGYR